MVRVCGACGACVCVCVLGKAAGVGLCGSLVAFGGGQVAGVRSMVGLLCGGDADVVRNIDQVRLV